MLVGSAKERFKPILEKMFRARPVSPASTPRKIWREWSIGIYAGESPFQLSPAEGVVNPVLTAAQVSDVPADFVADPFLIRVGKQWHMFFEVWNRQTRKGEIGLAVSDDAKSWDYQRIVLDEPFHLSYPYVFEWDGTYYMIPESRRTNSVRLYKAVRFPLEWSLQHILLDGGAYGDSSLLRFRDHWWLFTGTGVPPFRADTLHLFHAKNLKGPWRWHPRSPIVKGNSHTGRPAGRVIPHGDQIIRYGQDCSCGYGLKVRALEITELTARHYRERELPESPILEGSGVGWNAAGMHHVDPRYLGGNRWLASVDGQIAHEYEGTGG